MTYAQIDGAYDSLMTRYAAMASGLPADQRQVYQAMHRMYGQATDMRRLMLSDAAMGRRWDDGGADGMMGRSGGG